MSTRKHNRIRGTTLIEVMVYIALFTMIIGGAVVTAYQVFESSGRSQTRAMLEDEGEFLLAKIGWALSGVQSVAAPGLPAPGVCTESNTLSVTKWDPSIGVVLIDLSGTTMQLSRRGLASKRLTGEDIAVDTLSFTRCLDGGSVQGEWITTRFTMSAHTQSGAVITKDFFMTTYLRK